MNKQSLRNIGNAILTVSFVLLIVFAIATLVASKSPKPPTPVSIPGSSIEKVGTMSYDVNAYKVTVDDLTFLVITNDNKGGVAITRIK